jgi:hypothetical protein
VSLMRIYVARSALYSRCLAAVVLLGCSGAPVGRTVPVSESASVDRDHSCAVLTRRDDIAHVRVFSAGVASYPTIEIGLRPLTNNPQVLPVFYESGLAAEGWMPRWRREHGAYAVVYWPDTLVTADSGTITIEESSPERLRGRYWLRGQINGRLRQSGRVVQFAGQFDALRDTAYERFTYRTVAEFGMRPPKHRCDAPPT